uniref:Uncharacterized protein n=1 Tax=Helicotheca tamesis TaxID=374047 RepID=A0A7S2E360_9STRA|mmetsp:Transcript_11585/g.16084  ORF Transcript_11585/g.16084 Transcript_11585/m.16084 type:complete len:108 (+) Transcript_11585:47-370(+)
MNSVILELDEDSSVSRSIALSSVGRWSDEESYVSLGRNISIGSSNSGNGALIHNPKRKTALLGARRKDDGAKKRSLTISLREDPKLALRSRVEKDGLFCGKNVVGVD